MKTILAYGDSLTWGTNARTMNRHAHEDLWPSVLEAGLPGTRVINAGLGGRSTMFDDHSVAADRNGARILPTILATFDPIDLVIIMLGTNDMRPYTCGSAIGAAQGMRRLVELVRAHPYEGGRAPPQVVIVSPPPIENYAPTEDYPLLSPRTREIEQLAGVYAGLAERMNAAFFDAATVATPAGGGDGVHLDAANTRAIGAGLIPVAARLLGLEPARR